MDIELKEIQDFLARQRLFESLPENLLIEVVRHITIRYLRRGQVFPPDGVTQPNLYLVRTGAIELRDANDQLYEKLAEADSYLEPCLHEEDILFTGHVSEDCLIYLLPCDALESLRQASTTFEQHFTSSAQQRLKTALQQYQRHGDERAVLQFKVRDLTDRQPVVIEANETIRLAAQRMSKENVSSLLVMENHKLVGMVTDRDLRSRCLADGVSRQAEVSRIMTRDLTTVEEHTPLSDALLKMTRQQIHHLPVMRDEIPVGNLSVSDIVRHMGTNSAFIASDIEKANSVDALKRISQRLPELQLQLSIANTPARQIGEIFSMLSDALTRRLLKLAEEKLGAAPVPYVWLAGGSQGRNEQTSHSDQDNALFIDDSLQDDDAGYFEKLSQYVCDGLNECGFVYCPGNAMASNPRWRQPVRQWREYFRHWIESPEKKALMLASIFFDLRPVHGQVALFKDVQREMLLQAKHNQIFIAFMVSNALSHRPPLGFFRNFVLIHDREHDNTLDIKHRGIAPIVDIARVYAMIGGIAKVNSNERLQAAHESGAMSQAMSVNLIDALAYISNLRNQHQAEQIRQGIVADNYLDPKSLSGLERGHLKDAFMIIKSMQEVLEQRYQSGRIA